VKPWPRYRISRGRLTYIRMMKWSLSPIARRAIAIVALIAMEATVSTLRAIATTVAHIVMAHIVIIVGLIAIILIVAGLITHHTRLRILPSKKA
jgi:fatty acid desaturase